MSNVSTVVGVPYDCTGRFAGCERLPAALRAAGIVERLGVRDAGNLQVAIADPRRDPATGIVGFRDQVAASGVIRDEVGVLLEDGEHPLVIGGDCSLLIGAVAAARRRAGKVGLAFVDGHLDFYDGESSPTGEAADMELAVLSGIGPDELTGLGDDVPLLAAESVVVLGARDADTARFEGSPDPRRLAPEMDIYEPARIRASGARELGERVSETLASNNDAFWLHLDLDVLDAEELPAVDYPQPGGITWEELSELARPLAASPALLGADVTILNPTLDPDGRSVERAARLLAEIFGDGVPGSITGGEERDRRR